MLIIKILLYSVASICIIFTLGTASRKLINGETMAVRNSMRIAEVIAYGGVTLGYIYLLFDFIQPFYSLDSKHYYTAVWIITLALSALFVIQEFRGNRLHLPQITRLELFVYTLFILFGLLAILCYPFVYDSAQLGSLIQYIDSDIEFSGDRKGMFSYSGLIMPLIYLAPDSFIAPVVSSLKLILCILFGSCILASAKVLKTEKGDFLLPCLLIIFASSSLGLYGVAELGKDTIFGIAFLWLFMLSFHENLRNKLSEKSQAIFFVAAFSFGIVTLPYLALYIFLLSILTNQIVRILRVINYVLIFGGPGLAVSVNLTTGIPFIYLFSAILLVVALLRIIDKESWLENAGKWNIFTHSKLFQILILGVCICIIVALSPLTGNLDPEFNSQWPSLRPPLGIVEFFPGLVLGPNVENVMSVFIFFIGTCCIVLGIIFSKNREVSAILLLPILGITFCIVHVYIDASVIRYRLLWDLYKDIPQWLSGLYMGFSICFLIQMLSKKFCRYKQELAAITIALCGLALFAPLRGQVFPLSRLTQPAIFSQISARKSNLMTHISDYSYMNPTLSVVILERGTANPGPRSLNALFGYTTLFEDQLDSLNLGAAPKNAKLLHCYRRMNNQSQIIEELEELKLTGNILDVDDVKCEEYFLT